MKHSQAATRPILDKVVSALQADGVTRFATTGYCFGGMSSLIGGIGPAIF